MRIPKPVFARGRYLVALGLIAGSVAFLSADKRTIFPRNDRSNVANPQLVAWVQPGLLYKVVSTKIASDGTVSVDFKTTDPNGAALDATGVVTPGTISTSFLLASIPQGQTEFVSYITRTVTAAKGGATATQASGESSSTGTLTTVAMGEYLYTFKTKVPSTDDPTATHRVGLYGSRNLTQFGLGTNYASVTYDWVPNGSTPAPRDIVRTADCNSCHDVLAFHGGSRQGVDLCIMCHTQQTSDPNTGETLDMKVFIHKIHMGASLPGVQAGTPYQIYNFQNAPVDFSTVVYPSNPGDPRNCAGSCHNPKNGAAQTKYWMTQPGQAACGSCHDNVNFATGANHAGLAQSDDSKCATCHIPSSGQEFDLSIIGAHANPTESISAPGINLAITKVANGLAGKAPTVSFTITDNSGNGIPMSAMTGGENRLALVMAGPTSDYGLTSFGSDVTTPGYVSENPVPTAQCDASGNCTYTFTHSIPANAKGTYAMGIEGRRGLTLPNAPASEQSTEYGAINKVSYFSVDGSPVTPRRTVVSINNCDQCHTKLSVHGENRNQIEMCVLCHNPDDTDASTRSSAVVAADKSLPPQGINFAMMIHKIHTGETLGAAGLDYIIVGFGGSHNSFGQAFASVPSSITKTGLLYPAMTPTGGVADTAKCYMCHVNSSEGVFPEGKNPVTDPQGLVNPVQPTTSACTACHFDTTSLAHALQNSDPKFGEACDVCHATGATYDVDVVHAGK
ncbi:MAG: OmcA/MtrC family decaheme c-type cytochrome [Bryobacteraceae bacterium]